MGKFLLLFLLILSVLFTGELTPPVQQWIVVPWTEGLARICVGLAQVLDRQVVVQGIAIINPVSGIGVEVQAGCNGIEAAIVLLAAVLAFPAPWRYKLAGLAAGLVAIQGLNVIRVISLFYLGQWNRTLFDWAHLYLWQALIMLDVLVVWLIWVRALPSRNPAHA
ncbi:MAG: exosortase H [Sulfuricella sp.]|nr:exosortase H [Sulfuricella sp.]